MDAVGRGAGRRDERPDPTSSTRSGRVERQGVPRPALLAVRRDDGDLAERLDRLDQRHQSRGVKAISLVTRMRGASVESVIRRAGA